jgi:Trypsin-like peptidase domain
MRAKTRTQIRFGPLALGQLTRCNRSLSTCPRARSSNIQLKPILRFIIGLVFATAALASPGFGHAQPTDDSLRLYAVDIWQDPPQSWGPGRGVYLGKGLIITAAHVVTPAARTKPSVRIAGMDLPATAIREGNFEQVDLTLLSIDEQKLPIYLQMRRMPLCDNKPWPGEPVIVAIPEGTARSHVMLPSLLPAEYQKRFSTVIRDVVTTGNSGSGVFDAGQKCLLGIISLKIYQTPSNKAPESERRDIAKYFVPASTIRTFIPPEYRL